MNVVIIIIACLFAVVALLGGVYYFIAVGKVLKNGQAIKGVKFSVSAGNIPAYAHAGLSIGADGYNYKLANGDVAEVNSVSLDSSYFNNGISAGYSYGGRIPAADQYKLSIRRSGQAEITKTIKSFTFTIQGFSQFSKSKDLEIPFTASIPFSIEDLGVTLSDPGPTGESIFTDGRQQHGLLVSDIKIIGNKIIVPRTAIGELRNGPLKIWIGLSRGDFSVDHSLDIEMTE